DRIAIHCRDHRLSQQHTAHTHGSITFGVVGSRALSCCNGLEIIAGAESPMVTTQNPDRGIRIRVERAKCRLQFQAGGMVDGVAPFWAIHDDRGYGSVFFNSYWHGRPRKLGSYFDGLSTNGSGHPEPLGFAQDRLVEG